MERYLRVNLLGPGPSSYKKRIYWAAVSQRLRNTALTYLEPLGPPQPVVGDLYLYFTYRNRMSHPKMVCYVYFNQILTDI